MKAIPTEIREMFEDTFGRAIPLDAADSWSFYSATRILRCSLRDVFGNGEDFEWELTLKSR